MKAATPLLDRSGKSRRHGVGRGLGAPPAAPLGLARAARAVRLALQLGRMRRLPLKEAAPAPCDENLPLSSEIGCEKIFRFGPGSVGAVAGPTSSQRRRNMMIWRYSLPVR